MNEVILMQRIVLAVMSVLLLTAAAVVLRRNGYWLTADLIILASAGAYAIRRLRRHAASS